MRGRGGETRYRPPLHKSKIHFCLLSPDLDLQLSLYWKHYFIRPKLCNKKKLNNNNNLIAKMKNKIWRAKQKKVAFIR